MEKEKKEDEFLDRLTWAFYAGLMSHEEARALCALSRPETPPVPEDVQAQLQALSPPRKKKKSVLRIIKSL